MSQRKTFRLSKQALDNLEAYLKKVTKTNLNATLNDILENLNLEQPKKEENGETFFLYPPFLYCPLIHTWALKQTILSKDGCKDCLEKKKCPAWHELTSKKPFRLPHNKSRTYRQTHTEPEKGIDLGGFEF